MIDNTIVLLGIKKMISQKYLGKFGIHGVSVRKNENSICLYTNNKSKLINASVFKEIEKEVGDINIIVKECNIPTIK